MAVRRLKTYTAQTGYVYQYYFVGKREALTSDSELPATEYVFDVSCDRQTYFAISILVRKDALDAWGASTGRTLSETEQYAVAKMALFQCFDEVEDMAGSKKRFFVAPENIETFVEALNLD